MRAPTRTIAKIYLIRANINVGERIALPQNICAVSYQAEQCFPKIAFERNAYNQAAQCAPVRSSCYKEFQILFLQNASKCDYFKSLATD
jgi:hypothetical protein